MLFIKFEIIGLTIAVIVGVVSLIFKIDRYKTKSTKEEGWQKTGEKFRDKDKRIEVYFNPKTGERSYKESK